MHFQLAGYMQPNTQIPQIFKFSNFQIFKLKYEPFRTPNSLGRS